MDQSNRILMIMEVSRKQDYIFASKQLRENITRSLQIANITKSAFLAQASGGLYREEDHLVNEGGGHVVLQFPEEQTARQFARKVTRAVMERYPELELFVKMLPYEPQDSPGENLRRLTDALEGKKARREASFRRVDIGIDPKPKEAGRAAPCAEGDLLAAPDGYTFPTQLSDLNGAMQTDGTPDAAAANNFIAVVHVDGNAMGARVGSLYQKPENQAFDACKTQLQRFSKGIQEDFKSAFSGMVDEVVRIRRPQGKLPLRPVILAGDDVCFVAAGSIGLECARIFLEKLAAKKNGVDGQPYSACAGVALVHEKYPFHRAYQLSEELCENAKRFGAQLDEQRRVSAMDWHIEFGQLKDSLAGLRQDYETEDGARLELRPVTVVIPPQTVPEERRQALRSYTYFSRLCRFMRGEYGNVARGKIKGLRSAMKQGEQESAYFLQDKEIKELLFHPFNAVCQSWEEQAVQYRAAFDSGAAVRPKEVFAAFSEPDPEGGMTSVRRSLFFDAIEMIDHFVSLEEETV